METKATDYRLRRIRARVAIKDPVLRHAVLSRDNHTCVDCGSQNDLMLYHIKAVYYGGETVKENLITLCKQCNFSRPMVS